jgi:Glycosyl hydrolases family 2, sugar binding domain/Glycosyl hydrolases family 2/Glycosyl hydrolases family 2, TIM barrel domain
MSQGSGRSARSCVFWVPRRLSLGSRKTAFPFKSLFGTIAIVLILSSCLAHAESIDLSGKWQFQMGSTAAEPFTDTIRLPGTVSQAGKGTPFTQQAVLPPIPPENLVPKKGILFGRSTNYATEDLVLIHLQQRFSYIGPAWYRRTVNIPKNWAGKDVELVLERVMWKSQVWINGQYIGAENSLTTPHRYEISAALKPGRNEITICVDNSRQLAIGDPHAYTEQSQTIWNGIIGRIVLIARDKVRIDGLDLRPDLAGNAVEVTVHAHNGTEKETEAEMSLQAMPNDFLARNLPPMKSRVILPPGDSVQKMDYPMGTNYALWSEFTPSLYRMKVVLTGAGFHSKMTDTFGMREFKAGHDEFTINGQPAFLRGTVNCCEFPKTGYPDMTGKQWQKIFSTVKSFGLNHVRFHTWCPPEVAFEVADRMGIYLEVELPDWSFKIGQDNAVTDYFRAEGERMIREYGNHPSWVMLTMGNELKGDYTVLDALENHFRKLDPQLLYDSTTYPSSPQRGKVPEPSDDYYISQDTKNGRARGQDIFENTVPNTETNFAEAISCISVPYISHEVGQYCVYPNLAEIPKYNGVLRSTAMEAIRADLSKKGRLAEAPVYTRDSGKLATLLYKEEIERALRTGNQAGFQLLQLNDFPGQGTSTVGLLDAFWDSKGLITPAQFQKFCGPVVPLLLMPKRVFQNDEAFDAGIEVANFGPAPITNAAVVWKIFDGETSFASGQVRVPLIPLGRNGVIERIRPPLPAVTKAAKLKVKIELAGTSIANDWNIWVYPKQEPVTQTNIEIFESPGPDVFKALQDGDRVLLLPARADVKSPLAAEFVPVFWNPVMFPNQPGTMGAMIDARHPVFADFPTEDWTDWQWWELLHRSFSINLDALPVKVDMPFRFVDKFNRNALPCAIFEAKVGKGKLLVCTLDISNDLDSRIAARQLRRSILEYMAGDKFQPRNEVSPAELRKLFQ